MPHVKTWACINPCGDGCEGDHVENLMTLDERSDGYATGVPKIQYCPCCGEGTVWKFHADDYKAGWKECAEWFFETLSSDPDLQFETVNASFVTWLKSEHKRKIDE